MPCLIPCLARMSFDIATERVLDPERLCAGEITEREEERFSSVLGIGSPYLVPTSQATEISFFSQIIGRGSEVWPPTAARSRLTQTPEQAPQNEIGMFTVLMILGTIFALCIVPIATILGLIGFWILGFWGALVGVVVGLVIQASASN
jgi:hypothetical protein